jgi:hypothetical protein
VGDCLLGGSSPREAGNKPGTVAQETLVLMQWIAGRGVAAPTGSAPVPGEGRVASEEWGALAQGTWLGLPGSCCLLDPLTFHSPWASYPASRVGRVAPSLL